MRKFLIHVVVLILVALLICNLLGYLSLKWLRTSEFYKPSYIANQEINEELDYIVLGSSVGLTGLDTSIIDEISGLNGINLSMDNTGMSSHYLMLQHFLAQNKHVKYCFLSPTVTNYDLDKSTLGTNDYRYLMFIGEPYVYKHYEQFKGFEAGILANSKYLPMLGTSYYNVEVFFPSLLTLIEKDRKNLFDDNGNYTYPVKSAENHPIQHKKELHLNLTNPWLRKIENLCSENGISLLCYVAPMQEYKAIVDHRYNTILNYSDSITSVRMFYDNIHVNSDGRRYVSERIGYQLLNMIQNQH